MKKIRSIIPTTVVGSHANPSWMWSAINEINSGNYGITDIKETYDDAVDIAILDQTRAGIDIITDGEMRRNNFMQSFYKKMTGLEIREPLRKTGLKSYDSHIRYICKEKITLPNGLGITEEFLYTKKNTHKPIKVTCPGPLTLTIHIRPDQIYKKRLDLAWEFSKIINSELKELVKNGADFIQIDEPSFAIVPGELDEWIKLFNETVKDVHAKIALHICFGNLSSRPRGNRTYKWMFPNLNNANTNQLVLEFANRELKEVEIWQELSPETELSAGVIDVKSFYIETPENVANKIEEILKFGPPEKLLLNPDCGFSQLPRWITKLKLEALVKGSQLIKG